MQINQGFLAFALVLGLASGTVQAGTIVAPNANAAVEGDSGQVGILDSGPATFQWAYSASEFNTPGPAIPIGSAITSIGFRIQAQISRPITYTQYDIEVSTPSVAIASLTTNFANNQGADEVLVRSGSLTIPADLHGDPFFDIAFTTPFIYTGGDLLFTILRSAPEPEVDLGVGVDANFLSSEPAGLTNTVANFGPSANTSTTGEVNFFNPPVTKLAFNAVPEPATLTWIGLGLAAGLAASRRRKLN